jgi:predicted nucleic acid-binding protein
VTRTSYVDASGLVKLVIDEAETREMVRWYFESDRVLTSVIGVIETRRAAARRPHDAGHLAHVLDRVEVLAVAPDIAERAGSILPAMLRTLDAIHLATALTAEPGIDAFVTYDDRLAAAARDLGLPVVSPV